MTNLYAVERDGLFLSGDTWKEYHSSRTSASSILRVKFLASLKYGGRVVQLVPPFSSGRFTPVPDHVIAGELLGTLEDGNLQPSCEAVEMIKQWLKERYGRYFV